MGNEKEILQLIEKLQSGELSQIESDQLERYVTDYPEYKDLIQIHQKLSGVEFPVPDPDTSLFSKMRADVLRQIRLKEQKSPGLFQDLFDKIRDYALRPEMAVAALTLIIGFLLGRALPPDQKTLTSNIIDQISSLATENKKLEDVQKSPIVYSNVRYEDIDENMVSLSFDVTTHLNMTSQKNDPLVRDVMAQTLLSSSNVSSELKAISYTKGIIDPKLKEALIFSMHNTPILAIRMKAMSRLIDYKKDTNVQEAFLQILREEESVKMRLLAIDYLTEDQVSPDMLEKALNESDVPQSPAVMIKMRNYLEKRLNKNTQ
jgi:hypothetical protein